MNSKAFMMVAVVAAAAVAGGVTAYGVMEMAKTGDAAPSPQSVTDYNAGGTNGAMFDGAGAHFTSFTAEGYPDLTYAAENAVKTVVGVIKTEEIPQSRGGMMRGDPFLEFFGIPQQQMPEGYGEAKPYREQTSGGSGVIISSDGYIVTNHHVVENASRLKVKMADGKTHDAKLVGTDADTEIALIKINAQGLPAIPFGSSDALRLGEWVLAIGNPYELYSTVTAGIVSAKGRSLHAIQGKSNMGIEAFIQTDAAVNPGNSGGALVNTRGELVGINTLILSRTGSYAGYSFAVPETIVRKVVSDLREYGVVQRGIIGIEYGPIDEVFIEQRGKETGITEPGGVYVSRVVKDSAADAAGIRQGDVITSIDDIPVGGNNSVSAIVGLKRPGDRVKIIAKREGKVKQFDIVLRNRAGKSELLPKNSFDAVEALGGRFAETNLSERDKRALGITGGIRITSVGRDGLLARAEVRQGDIITHINGTAIYSVSDLGRITQRIRSIEVVDSRGKAVKYLFE